MAKIVKAENVFDSFVRYRLSLHASQQFTAVEKIQRELQAAIAKNRTKQGVEATEIILCVKPAFGLEVQHPNPKPLLWPMRKLMTLQPDTMLCGLSAIDGKVETVEFDKLPHCLIAGMTNAGKSVLMQIMLLSLVANNSPDDLELILIDLKNEDLSPFKTLPHVLKFAYTTDQATEVINLMLEEKSKRIEENQGKRIVLVIDELAQLANDRKLATKLGDLASIGRSKRLNLIAATQSVTKDGGIGSMMKANFSCRFVGKVTPGLSSVATGLPKMQAHLLPGKGSFLRIEGDKNHRFQSYYIDAQDVKLMVNHVTKKYQQVVTDSVITGLVNDNQQIYTSNNKTQQKTSYFPIGQLRDLEALEIAEIKRLATEPSYQYQGKPSINKLVLTVFGSKSPERIEKIKGALKDA